MTPLVLTLVCETSCALQEESYWGADGKGKKGESPEQRAEAVEMAAAQVIHRNESVRAANCSCGRISG